MTDETPDEAAARAFARTLFGRPPAENVTDDDDAHTAPAIDADEARSLARALFGNQPQAEETP